MAVEGDLKGFLDDLIQVLQLQAKQLEQLTTHVEQLTTPLDEPIQIPLVVSELSELRNRLEKL